MPERQCPPEHDDDYRGPERRVSCKFADEAADKAVKKTFAILGVDIDKPHEVEQFRISLRFSEDLRRVTERGKVAAMIVLLSTIVSGTIAVLVVGVKHYLGVIPK